MIVCVCMRVSDRAIRERADWGPVGVQDLSEEFGLGTRCGRCREFAANLLETTRAALAREAAPAA